MQITNNKNIPAFVELWGKQNSEYSGKNQGDYITVSNLLDSPYRRYLKNKHRNVEVDITKLNNLIMGTAIHSALEQVMKDRDKYLVEERLFENFKTEKKKWRLNGQFDLFNKGDKILWDYKTCKKYARNDPKRLEEYKNQLAVYAYLLSENSEYNYNDITIKNLLIIKDHSQIRDNFDSMIVKEYPLPSKEETKKIIIENLRKHETDRKYCTMEERWNDGTEIAIYEMLKSGKRFRKNASKLADNQIEAQKWVKRKGLNFENLKFEIREDDDTRCEYYCFYNKFCEYYQENH